MKAIIHFKDKTNYPLEFKGEALGTSESGSYTVIKDYGKETDRKLGAVTTFAIMYIEYYYEPDLPTTITEVKKELIRFEESPQ